MISQDNVEGTQIVACDFGCGNEVEHVYFDHDGWLEIEQGGKPFHVCPDCRRFVSMEFGHD